jgi:hypothetical protein
VRCAHRGLRLRTIDPMGPVTEIMRADKWVGVVFFAHHRARVAQLDCDIIIDEAPDSITPQLEQWQGLTELAKSGVPIPPDVLIEAAPNLKNKQRILDRMKQPQPGAELAQQMQQLTTQLQLALGQAKVADAQAGAQLKQAQAMKTAREAVGEGPPASQPFVEPSQ